MTYNVFGDQLPHPDFLHHCKTILRKDTSINISIAMNIKLFHSRKVCISKAPMTTFETVLNARESVHHVLD